MNAISLASSLFNMNPQIWNSDGILVSIWKTSRLAMVWLASNGPYFCKANSVNPNWTQCTIPSFNDFKRDTRKSWNTNGSSTINSKNTKGKQTKSVPHTVMGCSDFLSGYTETQYGTLLQIIISLTCRNLLTVFNQQCTHTTTNITKVNFGSTDRPE